LYRRLVGSQGPSRSVWGREKFLPSPQFDTWNVQPAASSYTVYATPAPSNIYFYTQFNFIEVIVTNDVPGFTDLYRFLSLNVGNAISQISIILNPIVFLYPIALKIR
jgi:hypothetical protein